MARCDVLTSTLVVVTARHLMPVKHPIECAVAQLQRTHQVSWGHHVIQRLQVLASDVLQCLVHNEKQYY